MAGSTRNRTRNTATNPPSLNKSDEDATVNAATDTNGGAEARCNTYGATHQSHHDRGRGNVSRLSGDSHPANISEKSSLHQQLHQAASEIDPLGVHVREAIVTMHQLEGLGLQRLKIPLPKIIVLGEQSTGKSSVIEAISGIKTPRSTGTCTRCPLFVQLESPPDSHARWKASVSLRHSFHYDGKNGRGPDRRFPGWLQLREPKDVEFMSTDDPDKLELIIARAQNANVSPLVDHKEFTKESVLHLKDAHQCRFSPNVVCISISQPGLAALSFYDLPGIIGQSETPSEVKFVRDLVIEYIKDPEALILVTCSMENDIANSIAGGIARDLKATDRCVGVLTKPDRVLESTCREILHNVFEEKRLSFGYGYFVVRNLGQEQLNEDVTHDDARIQERYFFKHKEPFATSFQKYVTRFGTWNLQMFLSGKLADQITNKLPIIQDEINSRLLEMEDRLKQYPEPPTHKALRIIFDLVLGFSQEVRKEVKGEFPYKAWRNDWKALQKDLFDSLMSLKPTMVTSGRRDKDVYITSLSPAFLSSHSGRSANDSILIDDDDNGDDTSEEVHVSDTPETPAKKKRKLECSTPGSSPLKTPFNRAKLPNNTDDNARLLSPNLSEMRTKFQLDEIAQHLEDTSQSKVPGHIEHRVTDEMMLKTLVNWPLSINGFFEGLENLLRTQTKVIFCKYFNKWQGTALYATALKIVMEMIYLNLHQQRTTMADESLADENEGPYIFHSDIFNRDKEVVLDQYRQGRFKARMDIYKREREHRTKKDLTGPEVAKLRKDEKLMVLLNQEPYSVELNVAAEVTTYYMIAARRIHDSICMRIESKFFTQLCTQLRDELENGLGIHDEVAGHRNAVRLLAEQSHREEKRQELLAQRSALHQGQQIVRNLQQNKYSDDSQPQAPSVNDAGHNSHSIPSPIPEEMDDEM